MKVIKVGASAQSRIAQACDRCRSKKIRCDGITPCCSQCSNVGFECKTSDKLSRRAFPRGYTESLEERVRALETEAKELKELLDEKDEKIDILSRAYPHQALRIPPSFNKATGIDKSQPRMQDQPKDNDIFTVQQSPPLFQEENQDIFFMGASSGRILVGMYRSIRFSKCHSNHFRHFQNQSPGKWQNLRGYQIRDVLRDQGEISEASEDFSGDYDSQRSFASYV